MLTAWEAIYTGQWSELIYIWRNNPRTWFRWFRCPCCQGYGGFNEQIIDYYVLTEPCGFCNEAGAVSLRGRLMWLWDCQILEWWRKRRRVKP